MDLSPGGSSAAVPCPCLPEYNSTNVTQPTDFCAVDIPTSRELFAHMPVYGYILIGFLSLFCLLTILLYLEEVHFILHHFRKGTRKSKTIWILAFFPVFSATGLLGVLVPRSGTLVDMVANVFFGTCLYSFGRLMINYMGGPTRMWTLIENTRKVKLNTPPCCCCCVCLPEFKFERKKFFKIMMLVMQVAIVRPILMFFAAVLWTNGSYMPGDMSLYNSFIYITVINLLSTCLAMYGLLILRGVLSPNLEKQFAITGKIVCLQLTLICSALPNLIIGIFVATNIISCGPLFPSKGRGEAIYHSFLVLMMLPFALLGRVFYRRSSDGMSFAAATPGSKHVNPVNELATDDEEEIEMDNGNHLTQSPIYTPTLRDSTQSEIPSHNSQLLRLNMPTRYGEQSV